MGEVHAGQPGSAVDGGCDRYAAGMGAQQRRKAGEGIIGAGRAAGDLSGGGIL